MTFDCIQSKKEFFSNFIASYKQRDGVTVLVAPAACYLSQAVELAQGAAGLFIATQNCYSEPSGAFTGELSTAMIKDLGVRHVIIGHSERRHVFGETDELIARKVKAALVAGLTPILCIGELLEEREAGKTEEVVSHQLKAVLPNLSQEEMEATVIAYEPVWAIGTGKTATRQQAEDVHAMTRELIAGIFNKELAEKIVIQYGGSVKPDNVEELMSSPNIDGALVGGASLKAESFLSLVNFSR